MNLIVCLDDKNGMMFNKRRQSQDRLLRERVLALVPGKLYMSAYSAKQFGENEKIIVCEDYASVAGENDFCFAEDKEISLENVNQIIIYRWNRHYPADKRFAFDLPARGFTKVSSEDFIGNSHPKITEEIYKR
ncbi:MAG: ribonuclease Z [Clostridia bacterium]|nr:ribonuclease Z [Clostridia bacterium]